MGHNSNNKRTPCWCQCLAVKANLKFLHADDNYDSDNEDAVITTIPQLIFFKKKTAKLQNPMLKLSK